MRVCSRCKKVLDDIDFNWKIKGISRAYNCRKCSQEYIKSHYERNRKYYLEKAERNRKKNRQACFEYLKTYLSQHPCVDCGEKDIIVLEFDHKEWKKKRANVGDLLANNATPNKLAREVAKCEIRCANCHRRKTMRENNSWRLK